MIDCFKILTELQKKGITNADVARTLKVSTGTVSYWKSAQSLSLESAVKLMLFYCDVTKPTEVQIFASTTAYKIVITPCSQEDGSAA